MGGLDHAGQAYAAVIQPPFSFLRLAIRLAPAGLCALEWCSPQTPCKAPRGQLATTACRQLQAYFEDPRHVFSLPLALGGSPFQQRVWQALQAIPPAETRTYGEIARLLGSSPRAVGGACRANPVPLVVPCHRVLAATGLGGYGGATGGVSLALKRWLLDHEGRNR